MELKETVNKLLRAWALKAGDNSKFLYFKIQKELKDKEIKEIEDLRSIKFIGTKIFNRIKEELECYKFINNNSQQTNLNSQCMGSQLAQEMREIIGDFNKLSSNLSEMEIKYKDDIDIEMDDNETKIENDQTFAKFLNDEIDLSFGFSDEMMSKINTSMSLLKMTEIPDKVIVVETSEELEGVRKLEDVEKIQTFDFRDILNSQNKLEKSTKTKSSYMPKFKSAAYAILKALHLNKGHLHKNVIAIYASKYTETVFDKKEKFSGFSSLKTLLQKDLIYLEDNKYYLTDKGIELSNKIIIVDEQKEEKQLKLIIDTRERNNRDFLYFQSKFVNYKIETRQMNLGDFGWALDGDELKVVPILIERKKHSDFISSTIDGRMQEQQRRMQFLIERGFVVFYLVEERNKIKETKLQHFITGMKLNRLIVVETNSIEETVEFIKMLHKWVETFVYGEETDLMKLDSFIEETSKKNGIKHSDVFVHLLMKIRGINYNKACEIKKEFKNLNSFIGDLDKNLFILKNKKILREKQVSKIKDLFRN